MLRPFLFPSAVLGVSLLIAGGRASSGAARALPTRSHPANLHSTHRSNYQGARSRSLTGIATPCGLYLSSLDPDTLFLILVPGHKVRSFPPQHPEYFAVDDFLLTSTLVSGAEMDLDPVRHNRTTVLREHRKWELSWLEANDAGTSGASVESGDADIGYTYSLWSYSFRAPHTVLGKPVATLVYLTIAFDSRTVFVLSSPVREGDDPIRIRTFLRKSLTSVEHFQSGDELRVIIDQIRTAAQRSSTCKDFVTLLRSL
jgi:hypothetical protein